MENDLIRNSVVNVYYNVAGTRIIKYSIEIWHDGLKDHKLITAPDQEILQNKVDNQLLKWNDKWNNIVQKNTEKKELELNISIAEEKNNEIQEEIEELNNILINTIKSDNVFNFELLKSNLVFSEIDPSKKYIPEPKYQKNYNKPLEDDSEYIPKFSFFDKIFKFLRESKIEQGKKKYLMDLKKWEENENEINKHNKSLKVIFEDSLKKRNESKIKWNKQKKEFENQQKEVNLSVDKLILDYNNHEIYAIEEYFSRLLEYMDLPVFFKNDFELQYILDNKTLIIEYKLPDLEELPKIKEIKYVKSKNEFKESYFTDSFRNKLFDSIIYQTILSILHTIYEYDKENLVDVLNFNGWVDFIDKSTGNEKNSCIVSVQVLKEEFLDIRLENVEPKACFKKLKGVGSSKLYGIVPVAPILKINKKDKRFVESEDIIEKLNEGTNIAAMDWKEFEQLIREIFEKEFSNDNCDVKITQASKDGGVDAIVFDNDPLRGGKIVIQAKRYTNTVGVSAVRDLYGTIMNEKAIKGILVTTADFGPDSYNFAKDKQITLLNGGELLHLMEKHGHHVKIDIKEAKRILNDK